ncbi:unnamed protein product [Macrosiphum euphorbiae]|uniref:Uncharacterized protein n=1 Tax=Macrosiphum euphorbiae TaxID=13131 RepID=A0AAV0VL08_9HEMI|nr:unnamed protein product [Macrosiphum euphorbiae]
MQWSMGACLCGVLLLQLQGPAVDANFWDDYPVTLTQMLSKMQLNISGDMVRQMENKFLVHMPSVSKINSPLEVTTGETSADGTLVVGHIKGKEEQGHTSYTGAVVGGDSGGPAVWVTGSLIEDAEHTEGKAVINATPDIKEYVAKKSVSEHFDAIKGLVADIATKPQYKPLRTRIQDGLEAFAGR